MKDQRFEELLDKYIKGTANVEEQLELQSWYELKNDNDIIWQAETADEEESVRNRLYASIAARMENEKSRPKWLWPRIAIAASIALAIMTGSYYYYQSSIVNPTSQIVYANDIAPGKEGATLTLADGRKILINDALAGNIATQAGVKISKTADGELIYEVMANDSKILTYNTLSTTRGEQTRVRLPDGTLVFLNSASSLKYPTSFGNERKVELTGEAYFQVAHNKAKPFSVMSNGQEVEVLGTHFNINSYADEKDTRTTLLEGSVRLNGKTILKPGEQAAVSKSGAISVEQANVDDVIAWTDGKFIFDSETIESIMRKLSRWYDVEVVYEGNVKDKQFAGTISRKDNISKILDKITFTQAAHFKIEGRRITVMP
jgi:transmembrane sensor